MNGPELVEHLPFSTDGGLAARARIGLVALSNDFTAEQELGAIFGPVPEVALFTTRITSPHEVGPASLAAMGPHISEAASRLLRPGDLNVLAYGCTSASMVLGEAAIEQALHEAHPDTRTTNPATAAIAALRALKAKRLALLTPYTRDVNAIVSRCFADAGFDVTVLGSFNEAHDPTVAAIDAESLREGVRTLTRGRAVDAVFVSCTNIRLMDAVVPLESELSVPVTSSNLALAWHCLRLAEVFDSPAGLGQLFDAH